MQLYYARPQILAVPLAPRPPTLPVPILENGVLCILIREGYEAGLLVIGYI